MAHEAGNLERYRSGHNGADSKSDGRVIPARGFESHPLRDRKFISKDFTPYRRLSGATKRRVGKRP